MSPHHHLRQAGARRAMLLASLGAALIAWILAGCGGSSSSSSASSAPASSATTSSAPSTSTAASAPSTSGTTAKPGTSLAAGQPATVLYTPSTSTEANGKSVKLRVTVQSIEKGTLSDFNGIQLDANEKASTPDYVKVQITSLGPGSLNTSSNDPAVAIEGVDNTGNTQQSVTFIGDFPRCPDKTTPNPLASGQTFQTCLTFLVPGGIGKAAYTGTDSYIESPVTWKAG